MNEPNPDELREEYAPELIAGGVRGKYSAKPLRFRWLRWLQFRLRTLLAVVLLICAALAWWVWYTREEPPSALLPPGPGPWLLTSERDGRIRAELAKPTRWEFSEVPLHDAMQYIRDLHDITVRVDEQALEDAKLDASRINLTAVVNRRTLEDALTSLLRDNGLIWLIEDDTLVITTPASAAKHEVTYVYSLDELPKLDLASGKIRRSLRESLATIPAPTTFATAVSKSPAAAAAGKDKPRSLDERLRFVGSALIFRGTYEEHRRVVERLRELRRNAGDGGE